MITRMKKITLIVSQRTRDDFLLELRKAGVVHIKHVCSPTSKDITLSEEKLSLLDNAMNILTVPSEETKKPESSLDEAQIIRCAQEIVKNYREKDDVLNGIRDIQGRMEWFGPWGGFNPQDLEDLKKEGILIRLHCLRNNEFKKIKGDYVDKITIIKKDKGYIYLAFMSYLTGDKLPFDEVTYPDRGLEELRNELARSNRRIKEIDDFLAKNARLKDLLKEEILKLRRKLQFLNVRFGMKDEEAFSYLQGFCPEETLKEVVSLARSQGAGHMVEDPDNPDETPTLIRNPRWIRIIEPIFKFMNTLPGYTEFDISLPFLLFFSIFFAMLIGDAGYGIIFFIITCLARRKLKNAPKEPFRLMYILSFVTIIWGAITGTWFGFERIASLPILNYLIIDKINSFSVDNQNFMIYLCFLIGAVHLSIAHLIIAIRVINSVIALAQLGWISVIWGLFFTAGTLVIGNPFPPFAGYLVAGGAGLILLFSNPMKNIIKGILITLANLPFKIISSFADVVSYLRLFAVGLATVIVARSFNEMAMSAGFSSIISSLGAALILFFGHALNIVLGIMAVIVHGIRLNMLEFSGHLGMQWSGKEYQPFREEG